MDPVSMLTGLGLSAGFSSIAGPVLETVGGTLLSTGLESMFGGGGGNQIPSAPAPMGGVQSMGKPNFGGNINTSLGEQFGISGTSNPTAPQSISVVQDNTSQANPQISTYQKSFMEGLAPSIANDLQSLLFKSGKSSGCPGGVCSPPSDLDWLLSGKQNELDELIKRMLSWGG